MYVFQSVFKRPFNLSKIIPYSKCYLFSLLKYIVGYKMLVYFLVKNVIVYNN